MTDSNDNESADFSWCRVSKEVYEHLNRAISHIDRENDRCKTELLHTRHLQKNDPVYHDLHRHHLYQLAGEMEGLVKARAILSGILLGDIKEDAT